MMTHRTTTELEKHAERVLTETLGQMSGVDLKEMHPAYAGSGRHSGIIAHIDVFGHSYTLACAVERDGKPAHVRAALRDFPNRAPHLSGSATPIIIAPHISPEAQSACKDADAGFLDLKGNARLCVGELFIAKRSFPSCVTACAAAIMPRNGKARKVPRLRAKQSFRNLSNSRGGNDTEILEGKPSQDLVISGGEA